MTTLRVPSWLRDEVNTRAAQLNVEPWVVLTDVFARTQQMPPSRIPQYPTAVTRRYGSELSPDGLLTTGQLDLGALAARPAAVPERAAQLAREMADAEDAEAEREHGEGRAHRRSSRQRQTDAGRTRAGSLKAVVNRKKGG